MISCARKYRIFITTYIRKGERCSGADAPLKRDSQVTIKNAIIHLVRNAVDHGIENRVERHTSQSVKIAFNTIFTQCV